MTPQLPSSLKVSTNARIGKKYPDPRCICGQAHGANPSSICKVHGK